MNSYAKIAIGATVAAAVIGGGYYVSLVREIPVRVAVVERDVEVRVFGIGTVEAQVLSRVGFQISGKIAALHADHGDVVKAGALLAKLDDAAQRARLRKSEAATRQAAANLSKVKAQLRRVEASYQQKKTINLRRQTLAVRGTVSQEAADDAQTSEETAHSDLKVIEAEAEIAAVLQDDAAAQHRLEGVVQSQHGLHAPFDARMIARHKELGSIAIAGETAFTLIAPESIWVRAHVDQALAGGLAVGQTAFVRLRSEADRLVETEVVRIDQENDRVTEERRVYVRCRDCSPQHQLRFLGEQAEVEIVKRTIPAGLFVPLRLVAGYDGRSGLVWSVENGRLAQRRVQLGDRLLDGRVHVLSDLPAGVSLVVEEQQGMRPGRAARLTPEGAR
ncbi:MAG: HlyD family efflux transporter periplasmic adaptor subunit [Xanthobacteraceae bacterium]|nr:HlyD family efflux transporter periplasmic adaptor subunit [Xanthobacteraceae bacterium]